MCSDCASRVPQFSLVGMVWYEKKGVEVKLSKAQLEVQLCEVVQSWTWLSIPWKSSILPASVRFSLNTLLLS